MPRHRSRYRWIVALIFFFFVLLHQADKLVIGPLTTPIMDDFGINEAQMGAISSFAIVVAAVLFPVWGYLYDRFARAKLLALASSIWASTTWLNALAPNYPTFLVTRATTGIDDSSYPGMYSLLSDYFGPRIRGKVYGMLQIAQPIGFMLGTVAATVLSGVLGWRSVFLVTGSAGFIGFYVAKALLNAGETVVGVDNFDGYYSPHLKRARSEILAREANFISVEKDLADRQAVKELFAETPPEIVCHLAAQAGVRYSLQNPYAYQRSNLESFLNLIRRAESREHT